MFQPKFGYKKTNQLAFDVKGNCATNHPSIFGFGVFVYNLNKFTLEYDVNNMKLLL